MIGEIEAWVLLLTLRKTALRSKTAGWLVTPPFADQQTQNSSD